MTPSNQPSSWSEAVGGIEDARQEARNEFYNERQRLAENANMLNVPEGEISAAGGYLYGVLKRGLDNSHKRTMNVLGLLTGAGLNVDRFREGDRVEIENNLCTVTRNNGTVENYNLNPATMGNSGPAGSVGDGKKSNDQPDPFDNILVREVN